MKTEFTPGPWFIADEHLQDRDTGDDFPMILAAGEEGTVTIATTSPDADELYANAHLIAAAPALYKVCVEVYEKLERLMEQSKSRGVYIRYGVSKDGEVVIDDVERMMGWLLEAQYAAEGRVAEGPSIKETTTNQSLISAAPDLYKACVRADEIIGELLINGLLDSLPEKSTKTTTGRRKIEDLHSEMFSALCKAEERYGR